MLTAQRTSSMFGIMSRSHCFRKASLSKEGSTFKISVNTSDISVFEKSPPKNKTPTKRSNIERAATAEPSSGWGCFQSSRSLLSPHCGSWSQPLPTALTSLTYDVRHLVCDGSGGSDEGVVTLVILHLHFKEPFGSHRNAERGSD